MKVTVIIPARYESSRYPGKPLAEVSGKIAIRWTYEAVQKIRGVTEIYVATDDRRIQTAVEAFGGAVLMTSETCRNGTERVADALTRCPTEPEIVVNVQGDALLTPPWFVEELISFLQSEPDAEMATPILKCDVESYRRFLNDRRHGRVGATTVVTDARGRALYFSKEVIPFLPQEEMLATVPVYHHVGIYAYRPAVLKEYCRWTPGPLEKAEQLEQLRFLEQGRNVYAVEVDPRGFEFWELNNPEDVQIIESMIEKQRGR
ncbi:MAG TPA: 3-deoxy-manno-octulosonate cytidylyltransferase [Blastocatellia bacterium]|nr:3-deoxy-manno-octulosonate cytidylyltransferase [Blastocatellia bacterium]